MDWAKKTARRDKKHLSFGIWCDLYKRFYRVVHLFKTTTKRISASSLCAWNNLPLWETQLWFANNFVVYTSSNITLKARWWTFTEIWDNVHNISSYIIVPMISMRLSQWYRVAYLISLKPTCMCCVVCLHLQLGSVVWSLTWKVNQSGLIDDSVVIPIPVKTHVACTVTKEAIYRLMLPARWPLVRSLSWEPSHAQWAMDGNCE